MKLRTRLLLSIGLTLVGLVLGISFLSQKLMLQSFARLEEDNELRNLERARQTVEQMASELHVKTSDWAKWDDTYTFMKDRNSAFLKSNLNDSALQFLHLDFIVFVTPDKKIAASHTIRREKEQGPPHASEVLRTLAPVLSSGEAQNDGEYGLILHHGSPMLVSLRPIHNSEGKGASRGWVVFGSFLNGDRLAQIRRITRLQVDLLLTGQSTEAAFLARPNEPTLIPAGDGHMVGVMPMKDLGGRPIFTLRTQAPRDIYRQGEAQVGILTKVIFAVGLILSFVIIAVLERFALVRLTSLGQQVEQITLRKGRDRVAIKGSDELGQLASRINDLLDGVAENRRQLLESTKCLAANNAILECALEGIAHLDENGCFLSVNTAFSKMLGEDPDALIGRHWSELLEDDGRPMISASLAQIQVTGRAEVMAKGRRRSGEEFGLELTIIPALPDDLVAGGCHIFAKDVTERKQLEREIEHRAFHDKLTELPNRALFMDRISLALAKANRNGLGTAILFIDLDNFKVVNDSLGHDAGDALLVEVAHRLRQCVRPGDTVSRLGGDEFTILLEDLGSSEEAEIIAQRVLDVLRQPIALSKTEAFASATIGIAFADSPDTTPEVLMKNADITMYHAKAKGKAGYAVYHESMRASAAERLELETCLRRAIESKELHVEYQPFVDLTSGRIIGSEALARWNHPILGSVPPSKFIPIAEETGLILDLGYQVMEAACLQTNQWQLDLNRPDLTISVNLSGRQLQQKDVIERVDDILRRTGLSPDCLELEITESILMERTDCIGKLHRLRALGVRLALDDFGTGYSSLSRLSAFPINTLKIDQSFINRLGDEDQAMAVVQAIMALSQTMRMNVVSEGVETESQLSTLRDLGCPTAQGFLFARPMPAENFAAHLLGRVHSAA